MREVEYTILFPFCGLGGGAVGFQRAEAEFRGLGLRGAFRVLGGIDLDPLSCADFRRLTGAPALCCDIHDLTPEDLRAFAGAATPDVVFLSPPCKGASGLLSEEKSRSPKYAAMNRLALDWTRTMLAAWPTPPRLVLLENVPRLRQRAGTMLREVCKLLRAAGYVLHEGAHDCGELGGLAQHRQRFLLVARHAKRVPALLYQPPRRRVRACGEVLEALPLPGDPAAGPLHALPRISYLNWLRLALIPPGGDWRDLPTGAQAQGRTPFNHVHQVLSWDGAAGAVNGGAGPTSGAASVADPRVAACWKSGYGVAAWDAPAGTVTGEAAPSTGRFAVADPRLACTPHPHTYGVLGWGDPAHAVTGKAHLGTGPFSVADPRLTCACRAGAYGVLPWTAPAGTVTGSACIDNGPAAVADPRVPGTPALAVRWYPADVRAAPPWPLVLPTADGTWHRPLTTLELAALQGLPTTLDGGPLVLAGTSASAWRERIGNAVPAPTAEAIARQMLLTLVQADAGAWALSGDGAVWVAPERGALSVGGVQ